MTKLTRVTINLWRSCLLVSLQAVTFIVFVLGVLEPVYGDDFSCASGDVTCLIAAINEANGAPGEHTITLKPGIYSLQIVDNTTDGQNGLPLITGSIRIQASADDPPTVIERGSGAQGFRIFQVSAGGKLTLEGITVQRGSSLNAAAIFNRGVTTLQDTIITENRSDEGAIINVGTLNVFRSVIANNGTRFGPGLGGILNEAGGNLLIEDSTIAHNGGDGGGGIQNRGTLVVRNSSIIFNIAGTSGSGGGIQNSGYAEILNSTVAKNSAGGGVFGGSGGGGIANFGQMSITNSTIRENLTFQDGGGIFNSGILQVQNTIVAGNTIPSGGPSGSTGPDCSGT